MPENYTTITAENTIKCTREEAEALMRTLTNTIPTQPDSEQVITVTHESACLSIEFDTRDNEIYFFAEDYGNVDEIPHEFLTELGRILTRLNKPYIEFGVAFHASKAYPGSSGGTAFRITKDGEVIEPEVVWPGEELGKYYVVIHTHQEGITTGLIRSNRKPTKKQAAKVLGLNWEPDKQETLEITEEKPHVI